jgi:hypothetical protein
VVGAAVLATAGAAAGLYLVRGSVGSKAGSGGAATGPAASPTSIAATGPAVGVTDAQGDSYSMQAVTGGGTGQGPSPAPTGQTYAYADYVLTNPLARPVLLNLPADLFVRRDLVPQNLAPRCMWQAGVPEDMCTLPNTAKVVGTLTGSRPLVHKGADTYLPAHASYLVRITTTLPVSNTVQRSDLGVYVWNAIYVPDQVARPIAFPQ